MNVEDSQRWRRRPFGRGDADAIVAFCAAQGSSYDSGLVRMLVLELTSDVAGVMVVDDGGDVALVATVVDRTRNGADAASLETLAVRAAPAATSFVRLVVEPALAFARAGERSALHVPLPPALARVEGMEEALRGAGFAHAYDTFEMRRPASAGAPAPPEPLPAGWSWTALDLARADEAHAALTEIFRDAPSTNLPPLGDFRQAVASGAALWRALLDGDRIAGLVRTFAQGARGQLRVLGRLPAYRGRGIGPRLVGEGLRVLQAGGAGDVELTVEADNDRALDLYRRFSFTVVTRTPVFARALRA
jgi:ribosomal protein S18 acetylase RimI-like enzyme